MMQDLSDRAIFYFRLSIKLLNMIFLFNITQFYYDNNHIFHRETITLNSIVTFFLTTKSILLI